MSGCKDAADLFNQAIILLRAEQESNKLPASMEPVLHFLSKGLVRLTQSLEADPLDIKKTMGELQPPSK